MKIFRRIIESLNAAQATGIFALFTIFFLVRTILMPLSNDDYSYAFIWDGEHGGNLAGMQFGSFDIERRERVDSFSDIAQSMWSHYFTWGGRILTHTIIQFFVWIGKPWFDIANTIIFAALVLLIIFLANLWQHVSRAALLWIFFSVFILMKLSAVTLFWLTGSCNYMWAAFFQLLFLAPYVKALRSKSSSGNVALMILLGLIAGWSNEAGALVTICLTGFLIGLSKSRGLLRSWMTAGLLAAIVGCALMMFAPGNFVRLGLTHAGYHYTTEIFFEHLTNSFATIVGVDTIVLLPMIAYFLRRAHGRLNTSEILMIAFAATGLLVPTAMLFSPEFNLQVSFTSLVFVLVATTSAILESSPINFAAHLPKKFLRGLSLSLIVLFTAYGLSLIYVDVSIFREANRQAQYIHEHAELYPVPMPPMHIRHRFEKIHGDRSVAPYMEYFAGVEAKNDSCRNSCAAQYYGAKYVYAVDN